MLLVFGSINLDIALRTQRLPAPGETVLGEDYLISPGGKGANQAHAAQRYGMATTMVGAVGDDAFAMPALSQLQLAGVDLDHVVRAQGPTGCAAVVIDAAGENQIVVAPGANTLLREAQATDEVLAQADAVLMQMEINAFENERLILRARQRGCMTVLNNAPSQALPEAVLKSLDLLIVNEGELVRTAKGAGIATGKAEPQALLQELSRRFLLQVVVTQGASGVMACDRTGALTRMPAMAIQAVDTTGAGDTFAGVLTAALIEGRSLRDALARASVAAALCCGSAGAQQPQPSRAEIEAALPTYMALLGPAA